jgi:hypothetical protein
MGRMHDTAAATALRNSTCEGGSQARLAPLVKLRDSGTVPRESAMNCGWARQDELRCWKIAMEKNRS